MIDWDNPERVDNSRPPLRWFANFCNHIGTPHILKMFYMQDELNKTSGIKWNYHSFMWNWTYAVYKRWGTYYKMNMLLDELKHDEVLNKLGSDYDSDGHAYWDYDWHTNDPADDWRLIDKSSIGTIHTDGEVDPSMKNGWISE
jgi:hypothetical protein